MSKITEEMSREIAINLQLSFLKERYICNRKHMYVFPELGISDLSDDLRKSEILFKTLEEKSQKKPIINRSELTWTSDSVSKSQKTQLIDGYYLGKVFDDNTCDLIWKNTETNATFLIVDTTSDIDISKYKKNKNVICYISVSFEKLKEIHKWYIFNTMRFENIKSSNEAQMYLLLETIQSLFIKLFSGKISSVEELKKEICDLGRSVMTKKNDEKIDLMQILGNCPILTYTSTKQDSNGLTRQKFLEFMNQNFVIAS